MLVPINPARGWQRVATFEVLGSAPVLDAALVAIQHPFRVTPAQASPAGCSWFDVCVDFSYGERRAQHVAYSILVALQSVAAEGLIEGYRLVTGQHYLTLERNALRAHSARASNIPTELTWA